MVRIEEIAAAALAGDALQVRSLLQDFLRDGPEWTSLPRPTIGDPRVLSVAAALAELLAGRAGHSPPTWTDEIGGVDEPIFLVGSTLPRTRQRIEAESPDSFKRRNIFVPANYASAA